MTVARRPSRRWLQGVVAVAGVCVGAIGAVGGVGAAGVGIGGCGGPRSRGQAGAPRADVPAVAVAEPSYPVRAGELVLVRRDAWLASDVGPDAPRARAFKDAAPGQTLLFRVVASDGDIVQVENLTPPEAVATESCNDDVAERLAVYRLRLFVHRADLLRVTARPVAERFSDGTGVALAGGVALGAPRRAAAGGRLVYPTWAGDAEVEVALPPGAVASSYAARGDNPENAAATLPGEHAGSSGVLHAGARGRLGGDLGLGLRARKALNISGQVRRGDAWLASLTARCTRVEALVAVADVDLGASSLGGSGGGWGEGCSHAPSAHPGIKVYWADGRVAGEVLEEHQLCGGITERGDLSCTRRRLLDVGLTDDEPDARSYALEVCFKKRDL
ncbi:MAG: hypothetical protein IT370_27675 [Deltaproteobacteria bacterium]|nr:hypothetical protein [Deltaproteobacteria bacterium]